jgi:hypothetical protein
MSTVKPDALSFRFERDPGYRIVPVNGIWGGPTIRGDIRVELFYECQSTPVSVTNKVSSDGLGDETTREPTADVFTRTLMVGMMLTAEQAQSIGQWLQQQAEQVMAVRAAMQARSDEPEQETTRNDSRTH